MNPKPFAYGDFTRVRNTLREALCEHEETYALVTGETGTGKTALVRELRGDLDRARHRIVYFAEARKLGAAGLVRVLARQFRVRLSTCHAECLTQLVRALGEETQKLLLWFAEAHELPDEALAEARALAESDLDGTRRVQVLLLGLPRLRAELMAQPPLWRRIVVREELTGLALEELGPFLEHHFGAGITKRFCEQGLGAIFEHAKGAPGLVLPMCRRVLATATGKGRLEPEQVEDVLQRWELA